MTIFRAIGSDNPLIIYCACVNDIAEAIAITMNTTRVVRNIFWVNTFAIPAQMSIIYTTHSLNPKKINCASNNCLMKANTQTFLRAFLSDLDILGIDFKLGFALAVSAVGFAFFGGLDVAVQAVFILAFALGFFVAIDRVVDHDIAAGAGEQNHGQQQRQDHVQSGLHGRFPCSKRLISQAYHVSRHCQSLIYGALPC